ncbi:hypothetical protein V8E54_006058 [Elaphomyces granulatus]
MDDDTTLQMDLESVRDGAELLVSMNEARLLQYLLDRLPSWHPSIVMKSAIQSTLDSLILSYPELLQNLSEAEYLPLSDDIFQNSAQVPELGFFTDAQGRMEPLLRDGLRWELFGLIFTFAGLSLINLSEDDPLLATQTAGLKTKSVLLQDLVRSSNTCIQFQEGLGSTSDLLVWLLYENLVLLVAYHGGISHHIWQRLGSLSTAIFASSLHQQKREVDASPLLIQFRQRLFAASYSLDKDIATLFYRPPMIPRQFCIWELPFDLDGSGYERNMGGGLEAKELGISLWNRVGIVDEASLDRIKLLMSPFREEILQLMLRPITPLTVDHQELSQRIHKTWMALPNNFRYSPDCWQSGRSPHECYILLTGHLEYLHTQFLFHRYITSSDSAQLEGLVTISRQILSTLLKAATQRERFIELRSDFAWRPHKVSFVLDYSIRFSNCRSHSGSPLDSSEEPRLPTGELDAVFSSISGGAGTWFVSFMSGLGNTAERWRW